MNMERSAWAGTTVFGSVAVYLALVPVSSQIGKWGVVAVGAAVVIGSLLVFPWKTAANGEPSGRLINALKVGGSRNQVQILGDDSTGLQAGRDIVGKRDE
ncbi:hypothetical protein OG579_01545 [Williamsia herbipolensis]|uniref:Uncharacterized protein n=1 Tax=Williamsia herbipolensis TaxID=1603258 RepID=A0AAU4K3F7_9NOCA|nr:hypothetical protein [Williamsia herbipolensis]